MVLCTEIATGREVAVKVVSREVVDKFDKHRQVFREKKLLFEMDNPFVIKLLTTKMVSSAESNNPSDQRVGRGQSLFCI